MNTETIKTIEEQFRLGNERLAFQEKKHALIERNCRTYGGILAIVALFVICGMAVYFGGTGMSTLSTLYGDILTMNECGLNPSQKCESTVSQNATTLMVPENSLTVVPSSSENGPVILKAEGNMVSDRWPLLIAMILNGTLVFAGLGVAAYTVKNIANNNE